MPISSALIAVSPCVLEIVPAADEPITTHRSPPFRFEVGQVGLDKDTGLVFLNRILCDHAEVMDENRAGQPNSEANLLRPPDKVHVFTAAIGEALIEEPDAA